MGIASSLAGTTFGVRLLHVREEELVPPALGALFGRGVAVDDRAALLAAPVAIATVAALHRGGRGKEVADATDLVRDRQGLDAASGLIRVDESARERIELLVGFLHVAPPMGAHRTTAGWSQRARTGPQKRTPHGVPCLWRWGRVELPVQGPCRDRVYERGRRFFVSRSPARTDALWVSPGRFSWARLSADHADCTFAFVALPG